MTFGKRAVASLILCAAASATTAASAADYFRAVPQTEAVIVVQSRTPACNDPRVLAQIEDQFEYGAPNTLGAPRSVMEFSALQEKAWFPAAGLRTVERRYCQGRATVTGGDYKGMTTNDYVYYVIEHPMGYAGVGWRAEGCFLGYDVWRVYGANCQSLRRF